MQERSVRIESREPFSRGLMQRLAQQRDVYAMGLSYAHSAAPILSFRGWPTAPSSSAMGNCCRKCGGERGVVAGEIYGERGGSVSRRGERERAGIRRVSKGFARELTGADNGDAEFRRQQSNYPHLPGFVGRVRQPAAERAAGVLDPFLVGSNGGRELGSGEGSVSRVRSHTGT